MSTLAGVRDDNTPDRLFLLLGNFKGWLPSPCRRRRFASRKSSAVVKNAAKKVGNSRKRVERRLWR